jgi:hypothetical protein
VVGTLVAVCVAGFFARYGVNQAVPIAGGFTSVFYVAATWLGRVRSQEQWERAWNIYLSRQESATS